MMLPTLKGTPMTSTDESTPQVPPPTSAAAPPEPPAEAGKSSRVKIAALSAALVGMVIGAVVEMFVQGWLESTGWFGPTLDTVIEEQMSNFDAIQKKLAELQLAANDTDRARLSKELEQLLTRQEELTTRTHDEIRIYQQQLDALREQAMAATGAAGGADIWLGAGESVSVGSRDEVFAVNRLYGSYIGATLSGKNSRLAPGEYFETAGDGPTYRVYLKQMPNDASSKRAGFDIVKMEP